MKLIFISGGAAGIGLATARLFAAKGWRTGIGDIAEPAAALPGIEYYPLDVRDRAQWTKALTDFAGADGAIDVLVNNAGIVRYGRFEQIAPEDSDLTVNINLIGTINGVYAGLPFLRRAAAATLVNIASAGAIYGGPDLAVYSATKFAVRGLSEALDAEFAPYGVAVRCIMPWFTDTSMVHQPGIGRNTNLMDDLGNNGVHGPDVPAQAIWAAVHGSKLHHPVGVQSRLMSRAVRYFPGLMRRLSRRQTTKRRRGLA
jgi:NAD(P)-dependent dehydrogenase (short-subunit alcohol dehydrogenase family)